MSGLEKSKRRHDCNFQDKVYIEARIKLTRKILSGNFQVHLKYCWGYNREKMPKYTFYYLYFCATPLSLSSSTFSTFSAHNTHQTGPILLLLHISSLFCKSLEGHWDFSQLSLLDIVHFADLFLLFITTDLVCKVTFLRFVSSFLC